MALVVPNAAEVDMLELILTADLDMLLFSDNETLGEDDDESDFTEAVFTGYVATTIELVDWVITPGDPTEAAAPVQNFLSSADQSVENIYGYLVVDNLTGAIRWVERFSDGPYAVQNDGDNIAVTPIFTGE